MGGQRPWQVLLLGGASGVGKTSVAYPLARRYGVGLTEVDDFQAVLERMTAPEQYPELHLFRARPDEWRRLDEEGRLAHAIRYAEVMAGALEPVIANHLDGAPIVLEGDFLLPALAVRPAFEGVPAADRVRALFLYEDEEQVGRNYLAREGRPQPGRAGELALQRVAAPRGRAPRRPDAPGPAMGHGAGAVVRRLASLAIPHS
jgi:2-phosphoglycerate kinase